MFNTNGHQVVLSEPFCSCGFKYRRACTFLVFLSFPTLFSPEPSRQPRLVALSVLRDGEVRVDGAARRRTQSARRAALPRAKLGTRFVSGVQIGPVSLSMDSLFADNALVGP